jgi:hypothetical protein
MRTRAMTSAARGAGSSARQREREVHVDGDGDAAAVSTQGLCDRLFAFSHFFFGKVAQLQNVVLGCELGCAT